MATQHYQPLSHALQSPQVTYGYDSNKSNKQEGHAEREEDESDDEDQGIVEQQLHGSNHSSPRPLTINPSATTIKPPEKQPGQVAAPAPVEPDSPISVLDDSQSNKRRPGRPRGSKTRKPRILPPATTTQKPEVFASTTQYPVPSPHQLQNVNTSTQQYYEFQWRVLNLCSEFYGAAEELVKATPSLVIAQSYQMGPGVHVDPLNMLNEAKRHCDTLLSNPLTLIKNPPAPVYPSLPSLVYQGYPTSFPPQPQASNGTSSASTAAIASGSGAPSTVITNPASFAVPLSASGPSAAPTAAGNLQYPLYNALQYPYYYPPQYNQAGPIYPTINSTQPATTQQQSQSAPVPSQSTPQPPPVSTSSVASPSTGNSGPWSESETDRLRKLYEKAQTPGTVPEGKTEWDWIVKEWGSGRTRNQILAKASSLGIRQTPARGTKRRRESLNGEEQQDETNSKSPPTPAAQTPVVGVAPSPVLSQSNIPSPSMHTLSRAPPSTNSTTQPATKGKQMHTNAPNGPILKLSRPAPTETPPPASTPSLPWPMPTVAVANGNPAIPSTITPAAISKSPSNYYRPNPAADKEAAEKQQQQTVHPYIYQSPGHSTSRFNGKPNGK